METNVGQVTHYYNHLKVAVLCLSSEIHSSDILHFCGHSADFYQKAWSMEIEHAPIRAACPGTPVAIKVAEPVHKGDQVFLVTEISDEERGSLLLDQMHDWEEKMS